MIDTSISQFVEEPRPWRPDLLKGLINKWAEGPTGDVTKGGRGALIGYLNKWTGNDENRRLVLGYLFGNSVKLQPLSTKLLTKEQWYALVLWIDPHQDPETMEWVIDPNYKVEALWMADKAWRKWWVDWPEPLNEKELDTMNTALQELGFDPVQEEKPRPVYNRRPIKDPGEIDF